MGDCSFYLKARFRTAGVAADAVRRLTDLLAEGEDAYEYWQAARRPGGPQPSATSFWEMFRERFPLVVGYLGELAGTADWDRDLTGHLSCMVDPRPDRDGGGASLSQSDRVLCLQLDEVWHLADLDLLERYCRDYLQAVAVASCSEEDLDPFDGLRV